MTIPMPTEARAARPDKRAAILDAAVGLFVEFGFHGTAVPQIAKAAGVAAGTIYRYFDSKDALVNALYREWKDRLAAHLLAELATDAPPRQQFLGLWRRMADFATQHPTEYAFIELHHHAAYLDADSRAIEHRLFTLATTYIRAAQARGEFRSGPPEVLWSLVEGAFIGLARVARDGGLTLTPESIEFSGAAAWELVRPP